MAIFAAIKIVKFLRQENIFWVKFNLLHTESFSKARAGLIETDHGTIETPIFMPVGTVGSVKAVHQREIENDIKAQITIETGILSLLWILVLKNANLE